MVYKRSAIIKQLVMLMLKLIFIVIIVIIIRPKNKFRILKAKFMIPDLI